MRKWCRFLSVNGNVWIGLAERFFLFFRQDGRFEWLTLRFKDEVSEKRSKWFFYERSHVYILSEQGTATAAVKTIHWQLSRNHIILMFTPWLHLCSNLWLISLKCMPLVEFSLTGCHMILSTTDTLVALTWNLMEQYYFIDHRTWTFFIVRTYSVWETSF